MTKMVSKMPPKIFYEPILSFDEIFLKQIFFFISGEHLQDTSNQNIQQKGNFFHHHDTLFDSKFP